jgi:hypothetical protein
LKKTEQQKRVEEHERAALEKREKAEAVEKDRRARRVEQGVRLKEELAAKEEARYLKRELARRDAAAQEFKMELALAKRLKQQQAKRNATVVASAPAPHLGAGATYAHIVEGAKALVAVEVPGGERPGFVWTDGGCVIKVNAGKHVALAGQGVAVGWRLCVVDGKPIGLRATYDAVKQRLNGVKTSNKPYTLAFEPPAPPTAHGPSFARFTQSKGTGV